MAPTGSPKLKVLEPPQTQTCAVPLAGGRRQEFSFGGYSPGGLRNEAPVRVLGTPAEAEAVCRNCLQILTAIETIKI